MKNNKIFIGISLILLSWLCFSCNIGGTDVTTVKTGEIKGKVIYENSDNPAGIVVTLDKTDGVRAISINIGDISRAIAGTAVTDSKGSYSFTNLEPGLYTVYASSNDSTEKAVATNVEVRAGSDVSVADLKLTATGSISGTITVDKKKSGNDGFIVFVAGTSYMAITDTTGNYTLTGVPAGKDYQIIMMKGGLTFSLTELVKVEAGKTATIKARDFTSEEIKSGITGEKGDTGEQGIQGEKGEKGETGEQGIQGEKGDTGETGAAGVSIVWRGYAADSTEIENPSALDAFYNTTDGCSYIYDGTEWQLLAKGGADGKDGAENYQSIDEKYNIECYATDRGIKFVTKILSNISGESASVTFSITENESGIEMVRNWTKSSNNWITCETYYPFVDANKEYSFTVIATQSDYTLYNKTIVITATGGLGEFRIENKDDYDVELTEDRVMQITGKPEFTDNKNVNILRQRTFYELYDANGFWFFNSNTWFYSWLDPTYKIPDVLSLKDPSNWLSYNYLDACLRGRQYMARARTQITVAGYQDNGQTYFNMADQKTEIKDWGGEVAKVILVYYGDTEKIGGLPGETKEVTLEEDQITEKMNVSTVNFVSYIYEPAEAPYVKACESSVLTGWKMQPAFGSKSEVSFPYYVPNVGVRVEEGETQYITVNGEKYIDGIMFYPIINATYKVTIMDGDKEFVTTTALVKDVLGVAESDNYTLETKPEKEGYILEGLYTDKELTIPVTTITENNMIVYSKWQKLPNEMVNVITQSTTITGDQSDGVFLNGRTVTLSPYSIGKYQVTQALYEEVMGTNPSCFSDYPSEGETQELRPVEEINWYRAIAFCNKLSLRDGYDLCYSVKDSSGNEIDWENLAHSSIPTSSNSNWYATVCDMTKNGYRLPTEAEWEFAARGGDQNADDWNYYYAGSDEISDVAWNYSNSNYQTHEVGTKNSNRLGLYDMSGNVWEWCNDWYDGIDSSETVTDPAGAASGSYRVQRGGSYYYGSICAVAYRNYYDPYYYYDRYGFRLARSSSN